tara:strand:- start:1388 stop:2122 length:735 start_codon:yes stop_codon:yes gene_type:complete
LPKVTLIIQARMGSTRLPGKMLLNLADKPFINQILTRLSNCKLVDQIVVAIPDTSENDILESVIDSSLCGVFRGDENDCVDRFYLAHKEFGGDFIIRFPGDNFAPDFREIDRLVDYHINFNPNGFSTNLTNVFDSGYPDGIGGEIFSEKLLDKIYLKNKTNHEKEHLHLNFFDYNSQTIKDQSIPVKTTKCPKNIQRPELILDINTYDQYIFASKMYSYFKSVNKINFLTEDIIDWYDVVLKKG